MALNLLKDGNETRWTSLFLLPKSGNSDYWVMLFKNFKVLCYGLGRGELPEQLDFIIHEKIEKPMGSNIHHILLVYKNLPTLNSFTRSKNPMYAGTNVYKYTIQGWLDEIEQWIFQSVVELEEGIRFSAPPKFWV